MAHYKTLKGFTLIELSIVLVIIGLIVGGILVGRDLISAAAVRAQISQIEKYQQTVNTFKGKYGYLPGDIPNPDAINFGFATRGTSAAQGDGNGLLQGNRFGANGAVQAGEVLMFWVDLSIAKLVDGNFSTATPTAAYSSYTFTSVNFGQYYPAAKIGRDNYVGAWSGGALINPNSGASNGDSVNYFTIQKLFAEGLTVRQAYDIDKKIDDGMPMSGNVQSFFLSPLGAWSGPSDMDQENPANYLPLPYTGALAGDWGTCLDNSTSPTGTPGVAGNLQHYSLEINNGTGVNCALSFKFQ